jgi:hypothetical protein
VSKITPSTRRAVDNNRILENLGLRTDFSGTWHGTGFNLVARPFFGIPDAKPQPVPPANLFLELNLTDETSGDDCSSLRILVPPASE